MKRLLLILILTLSFQTLSKADDISDFQIEGISIGDSALDYFSKQEITSNMRALKIGKKKYSKEFSEYIYDDKSKLENYDYIAVIFKIDDSKFIIQSISARINFSHKNINKCYELQKSVIKEIRTQTSNITEDNMGRSKHRGLPNGNSFKTVTNFIYNDDSVIHTACYDFSKKDTNSSDRISVSILSADFVDYQRNRAFKE
jgi:hypothetical protein